MPTLNQDTQLPEALFLLSIAVRTVLVLLALLAGIRIFGKRDVGGFNLLDVALILLLGNAVQNAITNGSGDLGVGLVAAATLLLLMRSRGTLFARFPWLQKQLVGEPNILVNNGRMDRREMRRKGIDEDELYAAMRGIGLTEIKDVRLAVLENDGNISIIPKD